jgi:hypothetical protein
MTTIITAHGFKFSVAAAEFDAAEREAGAEMIREALADLPAATVTALHANSDRWNGMIGRDQIQFRLTEGMVTGSEADCLDLIASHASIALMDGNGWSDSADVNHGVCVPMLIITGA